MRFFKKKKRTLIGEGALTKLSVAIDQKQKRLAEYLGKQTAYWNRSAKITALAIFCLLFGGACMLLLIHAIIH
jgi:hypothetical protein